MSETILVISTDRALTTDDLEVLNEALTGKKRGGRAIFTAHPDRLSIDVWRFDNGRGSGHLQ